MNHGKKKFNVTEFLIEKGIAGVAFLSLAFIVLIFVFVFREAAPLFIPMAVSTAIVAPVGESESYGDQTDLIDNQTNNSLEESKEPFRLSNLLSTSWQPVSLSPSFGLWPLIVGSFKVTLIAILLATPIGIGAAIFTSAFAPRWLKEILKPAIEILAGIPSVVIGFFALMVVATFFQTVFGYHFRLNAFVGGAALSLAVIPIIYTISEDAFASVPKSLTEASLALGAQYWEATLRVVLPAAAPGIFAAVLLGVGRAFGETMIVLMATGNAALISPGLLEPVRTLSATIGAEMAEVVFGDTHYSVLFFIGVLLFSFSFGLNAIAEFFVRQRLMNKFKGA